MQNKSILCIDDDPHIVRSLHRLLEMAGYEVDSTSLETASIEILKLSPPQAVLLDISMPSISGLKILEKIKATEALEGIPVIIVSGKDDPQTVLQAKALGAHDFISKPFEPADLLRSIRECTTRTSHLRSGGLQ